MFMSNLTHKHHQFPIKHTHNTDQGEFISSLLLALHLKDHVIFDVLSLTWNPKH